MKKGTAAFFISRCHWHKFFSIVLTVKTASWFSYVIITLMKRAFFVLITLAIIAIFGISACTAKGNNQQNQSDTNQTIENKGSDTMINLALAWAEEYQKQHSEVRISVSGGGTGIGLAALANNTVDIANASREIKSEEKQLAEKNGITPKEFIVARDAIAVIVHPRNPVSQLTLEQISLIYRGKINNWSEVGGENRPIVRLSRETNSGTHVYFLETVVRLGDKKDKSLFSPNTLLLPSSEGIITETSDNPNAIGYDGLGYVAPSVKTIAIAGKIGEHYVLPAVATVNDKTYPISRDLYMYTPGEPQGTILDYLKWVRSTEAQQIVTNLGFVPILGNP
ncbi:MAG: PstS family phosphate ABC transporter substrate-binding protein [Chloroflexota bacterium]